MLPRPVDAVAFSAAGEAFVPLDARSRPLGNAIVSFDQRAGDEWDRAMRSVGPAIFEERTGMRPLPHYAAFKLMWWRRERPDVWERTATFAGLGAYVASRLGASPAIGPSLAIRSAIYDPVAGAWDADLARQLDIDRDKLPPVLPATSQSGTVSAAGAGTTGLRAGTPIFVGGLDQACAAYDLGVSGTTAMLTIGTTSVVCLVNPERAAIPSHIPAVPHVDGENWLAMAGTPAGGSSLRWLRDVLAGDRRRATYDALVASAVARTSDVLFIPHLGGTRVAFDDPTATGSFVDLTFAATQADLVRAVLEGVAFEVAVLLDRIRSGGLVVDALRANGGGSRSREWMSILADVTGLPIASTASSDNAAGGAARLAIADLEAGRERPNTPRSSFDVEPHSAAHERYRERSARYVATYEALRDTRPKGTTRP